MAEPDASSLTRELATLNELLRDTRMRFHKRQTPIGAAENLMEMDREIRGALAEPQSPELLLEVRRLTARLRALDPH
jgi:hypothetical protein